MFDAVGVSGYSVHPVNTKDSKEDRLTLELLDAIDRRSDLSQRHLARQMGVALGLANSYLKRCVRKGYVKISEAPANRYLYYLTPMGFAEKARLTARYLSVSFDFYREAGKSCSGVLAECRRDGVARVLLCGVSDLAEIALLRAMESAVEVVGLYDARSERVRFFSKPVWREFEQVSAHDAAIVTDLREPLTTYDEMTSRLDPRRVYVPDVLRIGD